MARSIKPAARYIGYLCIIEWMTPRTSLGDELLACIARLNRWATRHADFDVPPAQARLLAEIGELGTARIGDLAIADHTSQPTMSAQIGRLEQRGWVERTADPADARACLISLSPSGEQVLAGVRLARAAVLAPVVGRLDSQDRERLAEAVEVLRELVAATAATSEPVPATKGH
jgi:DNA-binding MarR family transcriptional regulator